MIPATPFVIALIILLVAQGVIFLTPALSAFRTRWFLLASIVCTLFGGSKSRISFGFLAETGIYDAGSYANETENRIIAQWGYHPYARNYIFKWFYTYEADGETFGPFILPNCPVEDCRAEYVVTIPHEEWKNLCVTCYTEYVAPPTVVTNGVYHLSGVTRSMAGDDKFVTPKIEIRVDDNVLTPTNTLPETMEVEE